MLAASIAGGIALLAAWLNEKAGGNPVVGHTLLALCYVLCGVFAVQRAWEPLRRFQIDIHIMMLVGAVLALCIGHPEEGALLLFLFALSGSLEILATGRAERAVHHLGEQFPTEAIVERDGRRQTVRLEEVRVGDRLIVRPGDRVACDGMVSEGFSHVDESAITGEFLPRGKSVGEPVYAGSLNGEQTLAVRVTRAAAESTLARVAELVRTARAQRTKMETLIDRVGRVYGPAALGASLLMLLVARYGYAESWANATYRAIALLIVASPCALMLSTPVPILCAIANAARHGIVAKGGAYFERLARSRVFFVDKTGTLTTGHVRLADIRVIRGQGANDREVLRMAAALERDSTHPLATAIVEAARQRGVVPALVEAVRNHAGLGIAGRVDGHDLRLGRAAWAMQREELSRDDPVLRAVQEGEALGRTSVVLAGNGTTAVLSFEDTPRPGVENLANNLRQAGISRVELLTGDRQGVAAAMVQRAGLDAGHSELLPADKLARVGRTVEEGHGVVMLGDGVNDAPALARADVGIAMGGIGSHTALESADFVLLHDRVEMLPALVRLARRTRRIMLQNVTLALGVIVLLAIWVALTGRPILSLSVIGHEGSTLLVVANGLRVLSRFDEAA